ncbi:hypothetical protein F4803DRAFT_537825 [Xylaria telfairii]|nr:hypothetical protein F4803DRAFT_537825 [Xylaria telfairii]
MADNVEPGLDFASTTPNSSPSDILGDTKIRRPLVKIPTDQKNLLNLHQSWASFLGQRSAGFLNVPPQVLDQLKASYTRRKQATGSEKATELTSDAEDGTIPEPSGSQSSNPTRVERSGEDGDDDDDDEDPGVAISWPPSPNPPLESQRFESQEPSQPFLTQIPEKSPPKPTIPTSSSEQFKLAAFPQSSQGPDDELEVEVPAALAYNLEPINKSALPMLATPPSAQVVPCTFEQSMGSASTSTSARLEPQSKLQSRKHIYNRVPELYRGPKQGVLSSHLNINADSNKVMAAPGQHTDTESSISTNNMSSSIIPSTGEDLATENQKHAAGWDVQPGPLPTYDTNSSSGNRDSPSALKLYSPAEIPTSLSHAIHSPQPPALVTHPAAPLAVAPKSWEAPFVHYTVMYPSYIGTIQDFVTACIYIQLQYRRIRTSLYDDFIRAWVEGYLTYVKDCDEADPPRKALRAIEWYNEIDDDPLFTSRVVTRQNLQSILNFYPNELETARLSLGITSSQGPSEHSISSSQVDPFNRISSEFLTQAQSIGKEPMRNSVEGVRGGFEVSGLSPTPKPKMPAIVNDQRVLQRIPSNKSFGGIESRPAQREVLTRSLSESTAQKRIATNELRSRGTKRVSLGLASGTHGRMWSDSGITVSNHSEMAKNTARNSVVPESSARQKGAKIAEDAEERRRRRLAKHFKKRMAGRDNIASSAPISNTPTSGQKQK